MKILMGLPNSEIEDQIEEIIDMAIDQDQTALGLENEMTWIQMNNRLEVAKEVVHKQYLKQCQSKDWARSSPKPRRHRLEVVKAKATGLD